jgi:hypothetical protein
MAKIGKNHFLPHSITSTYKEIKCILKSWFMPYLFLKKEFGNHHPPLMFYCLLIIAGGAYRRRYDRTTPSFHHSSLLHSVIDEWLIWKRKKRKGVVGGNENQRSQMCMLLYCLVSGEDLPWVSKSPQPSR